MTVSVTTKVGTGDKLPTPCEFAHKNHNPFQGLKLPGIVRRAATVGLAATVVTTGGLTFTRSNAEAATKESGGGSGVFAAIVALPLALFGLSELVAKGAPEILTFSNGSLIGKGPFSNRKDILKYIDPAKTPTGVKKALEDFVAAPGKKGGHYCVGQFSAPDSMAAETLRATYLNGAVTSSHPPKVVRAWRPDGTSTSKLHSGDYMVVELDGKNVGRLNGFTTTAALESHTAVAVHGFPVSLTDSSTVVSADSTGSR